MHQLRLVAYPIIFRRFYTSQVQDFFRQQQHRKIEHETTPRIIGLKCASYCSIYWRNIPFFCSGGFLSEFNNLHLPLLAGGVSHLKLPSALKHPRTVVAQKRPSQKSTFHLPRRATEEKNARVFSLCYHTVPIHQKEVILGGF